MVFGESVPVNLGLASLAVIPASGLLASIMGQERLVLLQNIMASHREVGGKLVLETLHGPLHF